MSTQARRMTASVLLALATLTASGCAGGSQPGPAPVTVTVTPSNTTGTNASEPLEEEHYPQEVAGYALTWTVGLASYDAPPGEVDDAQRISLFDLLVQEQSVEEYLEASQLKAQQLKPGIHCYEESDAWWCIGEDPSGRTWLATDEFDTLTDDDLAAWLEAFLESVGPGAR